tara:strand:+ start:3026 stop:12094 length:9069 start_codon:yes stop_codon:yes gene_type:complete
MDQSKLMKIIIPIFVVFLFAGLGFYFLPQEGLTFEKHVLFGNPIELSGGKKVTVVQPPSVGKNIDKFSYRNLNKGFDVVLNDDSKKITQYEIIYKQKDKSYNISEPKNISKGLTFGFNLNGVVDKSYVKFKINSTENLVQHDDMAVRYIESVSLTNFDGFNEIPKYKWKVLDFKDMKTKNPDATFQFTESNGEWYLEVWNATDFDPEISEHYTASPGGTFNRTEYDSSNEWTESQRDALLILTFDQPSDGSTTVDYSGFATTTSVTNAVFNETGGRFGSAYEFDGDDFLTVESSSLFDWGTQGDASFAFWFKANESTINHRLISTTKIATGDGFFMDMNTDKLRFWTRLATTYGAVMTNAIPDITIWHHYVVVFDRSGDNRTYMYVDGVNQTMTYSNPEDINDNIDSAINMQIGKLDTQPATLGGEIDNIFIFNRTISATEALSFYNGTKSSSNVLPVYYESGDFESKGNRIGYKGNITEVNMTGFFNNQSEGRTYTTETDLVLAYRMNKISSSIASDNTGFNFQMDYPEDVITDNTGNGFDGTKSGDPDFGYDCQINGCYDFDGTDDTINISDDPSLSFGDGATDSAFSISAWVNVDAFADFGLISKGKNGDSDSEWSFAGGLDGNLTFTIFDTANGANLQIQSGVSLANYLNQWVYVTATYDGSSNINGLNLYFNGVKESVDQVTSGSYTAINDDGGDITIGQEDFGTFGDGRIDEIKLYNTELTSEQVEQIYLTEKDRGFFDYSETGNNGTYQGGNETPLGIDGSFWFDGSNDYIDLGTYLPSMIDDFAVSFWVNPAATQAAYADIFGHHDNNQGFVIQQDNLNHNTYNWHLGTGSGYTVTPLVLTANVWQHVMVVKNTSNCMTYINGIQTAISACANPAVLSSVRNYWLAQGFSDDENARYWKGYLDEWRMWNKTFTQEEVNDEFRQSMNSYIDTVELSFSSDNVMYDPGYPFQGVDRQTGTTQLGSSLSTTDLQKYFKYKLFCVIENPQYPCWWGNLTFQYDDDNVPTQGTPTISGSVFSDNLTINNVSTADSDGDLVKNIYNFKLNDTSITSLYLPFESVSDSVFNYTKDYSGNDNNASEGGGITWNESAGVGGSGAFQFDGVNDYLSIPDSTYLDGEDITIAFWIKTTAQGDSATRDQSTWLISRDLGGLGNEGWYVVLDNGNGKIVFIARDDDLVATTDTSDDIWHHIVLVKTTTDKYIYIDGVLNINESDTGVISNNVPIFLMSEGGAQDFANGTMDEFMIYNKSLSADQINILFENKTNMVSSDETFTDDNWTGCITPNDGFADGLESCSTPTTILATAPNTAPVVQEVLINSSSLTNLTTENLTCYVNLTDVDTGDSLSVNWSWRWNDGAENLSGNTIVTNGDYTLVHEMDSNFTSSGDNWTCDIRGYDGTADTALTNTTITIKTAPVINTVTVAFAEGTNTTTDNLVCQVNASDFELDEIEINFTWYFDDEANQGAANKTGNATQTDRDITPVDTLDFSNTDELDNWSCGVTATSNGVTTAQTNSSTVEIYDKNDTKFFEFNGTGEDNVTMRFYDPVTNTLVGRFHTIYQVNGTFTETQPNYTGSLTFGFNISELVTTLNTNISLNITSNDTLTSPRGLAYRTPIVEETKSFAGQNFTRSKSKLFTYHDLLTKNNNNNATVVEEEQTDEAGNTYFTLNLFNVTDFDPQVQDTFSGSPPGVYNLTEFNSEKSRLQTKSYAKLCQKGNVNYGGTSVYDSCSFQNTATNNGADWNSTGGQDGSGGYEYVASNNDWMSVANGDGDFSFGTMGDFSVMFWVRTANNLTGSTTQRLISNSHTAPVGGWSVDVIGSKFRLFFRTAGVGEYISTMDNPTTSSEWNHVAVIVDRTGANKSYIYLNGINQTTSEVNPGGFNFNLDSTRALQLGRVLSQTTNDLDGSVDDIYVLNTSLSADEVLEYYNGSKNDSTFKPAYYESGDYIREQVDFNEIIVTSDINLTVNGTFNNVTDYDRDTSDPDLVTYLTLDSDSNDLTGRNNAINEDGSVYDIIGVNGSSYLNGNQYLNITNHSSLNSENFSVGFWFKVPDITRTQILMSKTLTNGWNSGWRLFIQGGGLNVLEFDSFNEVGNLRTGTLNSNQWYYVSVTYNDTNQDAELYLDGQRITNTSGTDMQNDNDNEIYIGRQSSATKLDGWMDEIKIYNTTRTKEQINTDMRKSRPNKLFFESRTSQDNASWSSWFLTEDMELSTGLVILNTSMPQGRYMDYKVYMNNSEDREHSPFVNDFTISFLTVNNTPPTHDTPILNTSERFNRSTDNLVCTAINTADVDGDNIKNIFDFRLNGTSFAVLNMPFEEVNSSASNNTRDYSSYENEGTQQGSQLEWKSNGGYDGTGAYLFGNSSTATQIEIPESQSLNFSESCRFSQSIWINSKSEESEGQEIYHGFLGYDNLSTGSVNDRQPSLWVYNVSRIHFGFGNGTNWLSAVTPLNSISNNTWHHIVATYNSSVYSIYIDGSLVSTSDFDSVYGTTNICPQQKYSQINIGCTDNCFNGTLDDVMVFNHTLTPQQIELIYNNNTDTIASQETSEGDNWSCQVTPNDNRDDGVTRTSNNLIVNYKPTQDTPTITSVNGFNNTNDNITSNNVSSADLDSDSIVNIWDWRLNGTSIALLNMPFEAGRLAEDNGKVKDYSTIQNNGTLNGATYNSSGGYEFDGVNDFINSTSVDAYNTSEISASMWIKRESFDSFQGIIQKRGSLRYFPRIEENNQIMVELIFDDDTTTGELETANGSINTSDWQHIVVTYSKSSGFVELYQNGSKVNSWGGYTKDLNFTSIDMEIGRAFSNYYKGTIDEVTIWNRSLSEEQVRVLFENRTNLLVPEETSLKDNWTACLTPNDGREDGTEKCSSINITNLVAPPTPTPTPTTTEGGGTGGLMKCGTGFTLINKSCVPVVEKTLTETISEVPGQLRSVLKKISSFLFNFGKKTNLIPERTTLEIFEDYIEETVESKVSDTKDKIKESVKKPQTWLIVGSVIIILLLVNYGLLPWWFIIVIPVIYYLVTKFVIK